MADEEGPDRCEEDKPAQPEKQNHTRLLHVGDLHGNRRGPFRPSACFPHAEMVFPFRESRQHRAQIRSPISGDALAKTGVLTLLELVFDSLLVFPSITQAKVTTPSVFTLSASPGLVKTTSRASKPEIAPPSKKAIAGIREIRIRKGIAPFV